MTSRCSRFGGASGPYKSPSDVINTLKWSLHALSAPDFPSAPNLFAWLAHILLETHLQSRLEDFFGGPIDDAWKYVSTLIIYRAAAIKAGL